VDRRRKASRPEQAIRGDVRAAQRLTDQLVGEVEALGRRVVDLAATSRRPPARRRGSQTDADVLMAEVQADRKGRAGYERKQDRGPPVARGAACPSGRVALLHDRGRPSSSTSA